ncbi:hypothetical protein M422DRAFT_230623, partial [Sphaerobolus stellatus SS14]
MDIEYLFKALGTDYTPSSDDTLSISTFLANNSLSKSNFSAKRRILEKNLAIIRAHEQRLDQEASICHAALSPVRHLPNEMMSEIFLYCVPVDSTSEPCHIIPLSSPLVLLHVCRRWRRIALDTPRLF